MEIKFTRKTDSDFRKHRDYLRRTGKSDGHKYLYNYHKLLY